MARKAKTKVGEDPDLILDQIGRRVVARRVQLGLSRPEFAARLGITLTNIGRIERGEQNVTVRMMCRVAEALETTMQELMFGTKGSK